MDAIIEKREKLNQTKLIYHDNGIQIYAKLQKNNIYHIMAYTDKSKVNPYFNYLVRVVDKDRTIDKLKNDAIKKIENKKIEKMKKEKIAKETYKNVKIGDVLVSSWGYEQTNVNFYQVVDVKGNFVILRGIAKSFIEKHRYDAGQVIPSLNVFISEPFKKKIIPPYRISNNRNYYVKISSFETAHLTDPSKSHYISWGY